MNEILLSDSTTEYDYSNGSMVVNIDTDLIQQQTKVDVNSTTSSNSVPSYSENSQQLQYASYPAYTFQSLPVGFTSALPAYTHALPRLDYFDDSPNNANVAVAPTTSVTSTYNKQPTSPASISSASSLPSTPSPPPHTMSSSASTIMNTAHLNFTVATNKTSNNNNSHILTPQSLNANELLNTSSLGSSTSSRVTSANNINLSTSPSSTCYTTMTGNPNRQQQQFNTDVVLLKESSSPLIHAATNISSAIATTRSGTITTGNNDMVVVAAAAVAAAAAPQYTNSTTARVKEMISRANSIPMEFYHTEFLEYSKETYEKKLESKRNKRKRYTTTTTTNTTTSLQRQPEQQQHSHCSNGNNSVISDNDQNSARRGEEDLQQVTKRKKSNTNITSDISSESIYCNRRKDTDLDEEDYFFFVGDSTRNRDEVAQHQSNDSSRTTADGSVSTAEIRRQIHIQSEQKRRAQIKDGFDELRKHLPGCSNKKMSKAALLTRTVQQLQHLKGMQNELLSEVERLLQENEALKKFQHSILQRQAMEKPYTF
ncbi:hypothetical protein BDF20DRAFT_902772 [Mycotypha africana]|uniref:uncharacterized protein n=1 Tax=Mycotypha africana TaxID=64632 RepID=UPI0023017E78|nr:uncharacterized protein BDF20DRAFT_902772 [Mycotypha africana]KAI8966987.1 hypothetical protein BDF20DRAFT_902772 [Mycotypha africana]